jgi:hypothetical protein
MEVFGPEHSKSAVKRRPERESQRVAFVWLVLRLLVAAFPSYGAPAYTFAGIREAQSFAGSCLQCSQAQQSTRSTPWNFLSSLAYHKLGVGYVLQLLWESY